MGARENDRLLRRLAVLARDFENAGGSIMADVGRALGVLQLATTHAPMTRAAVVRDLLRRQRAVDVEDLRRVIERLDAKVMQPLSAADSVYEEIHKSPERFRTLAVSFRRRSDLQRRVLLEASFRGWRINWKRVSVDTTLARVLAVLMGTTPAKARRNAMSFLDKRVHRSDSVRR